MNDFLETQRDAGELTVRLRGAWTTANAASLERALDSLRREDAGRWTFQCGGLESMDITGAWLLLRTSRALEARGGETEFRNFRNEHFRFVENVREAGPADEAGGSAARRTTARQEVTAAIERTGRHVVSVVEDVGLIARAAVDPSAQGLRETARQIEHAGAGAVPVVSLVGFLMGLVLAYQGSRQLAAFGADVFVADLVTISMLREMGTLLAGIMVAGRSGSAFAAAIGVMRLNEETDALQVMGLRPNRILIAPRVVALVVSLPLLAVIGMIAGMAGGLVLSQLALDMTATQYLERTLASATLQDFAAGVIKAPVFAVLIAGVGTLRGLQVSSSATELGRLTTSAVVQSVFLIILADAVFTVVYSTLGI